MTKAAFLDLSQPLPHNSVISEKLISHFTPSLKCSLQDTADQFNLPSPCIRAGHVSAFAQIPCSPANAGLLFHVDVETLASNRAGTCLSCSSREWWIW